MAWSKHSTTTNKWKVGVTADNGANNAYDGAGGSVLEEFGAFLGTRGWTVSHTVVADTPAAGDTTWQMIMTKSVLCEDGSSVPMGYQLNYEQHPGAADVFEIFLYSLATGVGTSLQSLTLSIDYPLQGRWSFWSSDQDTDSFAVFSTDQAGKYCLGFWPPAGTLFAPSTISSTWPVAFGFIPLYVGSGPYFDGQQNGKVRALHYAFLSSTTTHAASYDVPVAMDFVYVSTDVGRPLFYTFGSDVQSYLRYDSQRIIGPDNSAGEPTSVLQLGSQYYIAVGDEQKLLLNTGTTAPSI